MLTRICQTCGKEFEKPYSCSSKEWEKYHKVCSRECRKLGENRVCPTCGKTFYAKKCHIAKGWAGYCSISCSKKGKIPPNLEIARANSPIQKGNKLACHLKGKKRQPFSQEWKDNISKGLLKVRDKRAGENHWNWHGGISGWQKLLRGSIEYKEWRLSVYKRDKYHCQICHKHCNSKTIVAHHIKSFKDNPKNRYDIENGITLCRKCHILHHRTP